MEQFRRIGEVLGSLKAFMAVHEDIQINRQRCYLLHDMLNLAFDTIAEEIKQNLKQEEKNTKWKALEQPLKELHRVFKEGELYIRNCLDNKNWLAKLITLHQNNDSVEFHIHNLISYFPAVIEAIENAGEISGLDQDEMENRQFLLSKKYDTAWNDPKLFEWRFGKQYLINRDIIRRLQSAWREDRSRLIESLKERRDFEFKDEKQLLDLLIKKLGGSVSIYGKLFPSFVLLEAKDYQVRRRLGKGSQYKEIQWLGESFALRRFFGEIESLNSEISSLLSLSHPNILQFLCGFYDEEKKECFLVMDLMNKDLGSYMKENRGPRRRVSFSLPVVVDLMLQISRGMQYLHSHKVYHGNLNPSKVFLKAQNSSDCYFQAKISDFGLSSIKKPSPRNSPNYQNETDPFIWYAPEVLAEKEQPSGKICASKYMEKADVYSFGMICFELLTGKVPFEDGHLQGEKMARNIRAGERPLFPFPSPKPLANLTKKCWQTDPSQRPSFSSITRILRYIKKVLAMKPDDNHLEFQQHSSVDYCDIETSFLKKFPEEGVDVGSSISEIPFQMFAYRLVEKEKTKNKSCEFISDAVSVCKDDDVSVVEDNSLVLANGTYSICSDERSVCSEVPLKKKLIAKQYPDRKLRKGSGAPKAQPPKPSRVRSSERSPQSNQESRLPTAMSPLRQSRRASGHFSDSDIF